MESRPGAAKILCYHPLPSYYKDCSRRLEHCGLFVTIKTMFEAITKIALLGNDCCAIIDQVIGAVPTSPSTRQDTALSNLMPSFQDSSLNESQNTAVKAAETHNLTCLWGPPGTGKTQTIVAIIRRLQRNPHVRILVTAPTHNAVDNAMRR